jgi:hypothetical protein
VSDVYWEEAPEEVIEMAQEVIDKYHPWLEHARVGFIMRSESPKKGTHYVLGEARKVSDREKVHIPYDFVIWLAADKWAGLMGSQRVALIDHELCHCQWDMGKLSIRPHDIEEFTCIIQRHGYWWPGAHETGAIWKQAALWESEDGGGAVAVDIHEFKRNMDRALPGGWSISAGDATYESNPSDV